MSELAVCSPPAHSQRWRHNDCVADQLVASTSGPVARPLELLAARRLAIECGFIFEGVSEDAPDKKRANLAGE